MNRLWELILGLDRGFLARDGEFALTFNPAWPGRETVGDATWNVLLVAAAVTLVVYVYRREGGRSFPGRAGMGVVRAALLVFLIALLNRPSLTLTQTRTEPSVLAVMIDDSVSMRVRDVAAGGPANADGGTSGRLEAAVGLLSGADGALLRRLRDTHDVRFYRFNQDATPQAAPLQELQAVGGSTDLGRSVQTVLEDLQGQRLAGVVVMSDGRDTPARPAAEALGRVVGFGVKLFPVPIGSADAPRNVDLQAVTAPDGAFVNDIANVQATVLATGYGANRGLSLQIRDKATGELLPDGQGGVVQRDVTAEDGQPVEVELQFKPAQVGTLDLQVEVVALTGELDEQDNVRPIQITVLDAAVNVLYVDGYPRWDYRFLKNELIRDKTTIVSTLLTGADPSFSQEGNRPITRFPEKIDEMLDYDVLILGDVDPRQFTDAQLQLMAEFVADKGGGFAMVAGPRHSPHEYRNTPIELILPVDITGTSSDPSAGGMGGALTDGFRPSITAAGTESGIFRFYADPDVNARYLTEEMPPIFWYAQGLGIKPGVGEAFAVHPTETGTDGRPAPILVAGRYGAGRTIFSAIDDSWRWRYYTGESVFDTYWIQQIRYLARGRKLGQRKATFFATQPRHELGETVQLSLRVLNPELLSQLQDRIDVQLLDADGARVRTVSLTREPSRPDGSPSDTYGGAFAADRVGRFTARLPSVAAGVEAMEVPIDVSVPQLELAAPQVDQPALARLAGETRGQVIPFDEAAARLPRLPSAERNIPVQTAEPLWDSPLALLIFIGLITTEWVTRKLFGML